MVGKAEWDSKLFKYPVGILNIQKKDSFNLKTFLAQSQKFKLVYIISEKEIGEIPSIKLMDKKVIYSKQILKGRKNQEILEYDPEDHSYRQLLHLAYLSGRFSRFKSDENFVNNEFKLLYQEWIDKSIAKKISLKVLVRLDGNEIAGFVTLNKNDNHTAEIGLIAVNEKFQGKNIGSELIKECEFLSLKENLNNLQVATQFENLSACRLYEKNNFSIKEVKYVYHYWNL